MYNSLSNFPHAVIRYNNHFKCVDRNLPKKTDSPWVLLAKRVTVYFNPNKMFV